MNEELIAQILQACHVSWAAILPLQKGYRNSSYPIRCKDGAMINLIIYKDEPGIVDRIRRADRLSAHLWTTGFPVRTAHSKAVQSKIICLTGRTASRPTTTIRYARLYNYLPGTTIPWEAYTMRHIKLLGKAMSDMHAATSSAAAIAQISDKNIDSVCVIDECLATLRRMRRYFSDPGVAGAMRKTLRLTFNPNAPTAAALARFADCLDIRARALPERQPLHLDFVRGNLLFADTLPEESEESPTSVTPRRVLSLNAHPPHRARPPHPKSYPKPPYITGILDFEKTADGPPVFDVARTLAFLLVDCKYKHPAKVRKYFLESGYTKYGRSALSQAQRSILDELVQFYLLHDFYKFLRHNPYESLHANEHFVRTRDILLKDGIIGDMR